MDWPTFGVGWPSEGSLNFQVASQVRSVVYSIPGYPDQAPYIDVWIDILSDASKYLKDRQSKSDQKYSPQPILLAAPKDLKDNPQTTSLGLFIRFYRFSLKTPRF